MISFFEERNLIDTDHSYIFVSEQARQLGKQLTYSAAYDKLKRYRKKLVLTLISMI